MIEAGCEKPRIQQSHMQLELPSPAEDYETMMIMIINLALAKFNSKQNYIVLQFEIEMYQIVNVIN